MNEDVDDWGEGSECVDCGGLRAVLVDDRCMTCNNKRAMKPNPATCSHRGHWQSAPVTAENPWPEITCVACGAVMIPSFIETEAAGASDDAKTGRGQ